MKDGTSAHPAALCRDRAGCQSPPQPLRRRFTSETGLAAISNATAAVERSAAADPPSIQTYTVDELARILRVSSKTVRRRIKAGTIRTVPAGGRLVRISAEEVRRLLAAGDEAE